MAPPNKGGRRRREGLVGLVRVKDGSSSSSKKGKRNRREGLVVHGDRGRCNEDGEDGERLKSGFFIRKGKIILVEDGGVNR